MCSYHVVVNKDIGYSSKLKNGQELTSLQGGKLTVKLDGSKVFINGAEVVSSNVLVNSGVVHAINA